MKQLAAKKTPAMLSTNYQAKYLCYLTFYIDSAARAKKKYGDDEIARMIDYFIGRYPDCIYRGDATRLTKFSDAKASLFLMNGRTSLNKFSFYSFTTFHELFKRESFGGLFPRDDFFDRAFNNVIITTSVEGLDVYKLLRKSKVFVEQAEFLKALYENEMLVLPEAQKYVRDRLDKVIDEAKKSNELSFKILAELPTINFYISSVFKKWADETHDTHPEEEEILVISPVDVSLKDIYKEGSLNFFPSDKLRFYMENDHEMLTAFMSTIPNTEKNAINALSASMELHSVQIKKPDRQVISIHILWTASQGESKITRIIKRDFGDPKSGTVADELNGVVVKGSKEAKTVLQYQKQLKATTPHLKSKIKTLVPETPK